MKTILRTLILSVLASSLLLASATKAELQTHKKIVGYFPEWGVYSAHNNYAPSDIPFNKLTHVNYAFAKITNGQVAIFDDWAATGISFNEAWNSPYKGTLGQFKKLKNSYPNTSFLISVGGWTQSGAFHDAALSAKSRHVFAQSCVEFIRQWNFDGVDIDWEFPTFSREPDRVDNANDIGTPSADAAEKQTFTLLLRDIRAALDSAGAEDNRYYQLTAAVGSSKSMIEGTEPENYAQYLDFINVMTYDMHGAWDTKTNHQSPIFENKKVSHDNLSISDSVKLLKKHGVSANKIIIGSPFYSRGWKGVKKDAPITSLPGLGASASGGANGIWDGGRAAGVNPYYYIKSQMENDDSFTKYRDPISKMPYLYSESKGEMYTYDDEISVQAKSDYVNDESLGGIIFWEVSADYPSKGSALTTVIYNSFFPEGHPQYANEEVSNANSNETLTNINSSDTTIIPPVDTNSSNNNNTNTTTNNGNANATSPQTPIKDTTRNSEWSSSSVYLQGNVIHYENASYQAKWWTKGNIPGTEQWGVWELLSGSTTIDITQESNNTSSGTNTTEVSDTNNSTTTPLESIITGGAQEYQASTVYYENDKAIYNGHLFLARWWTRGKTPIDSKWGVWHDLGLVSEVTTEDNSQDESNTTVDDTTTSVPDVNSITPSTEVDVAKSMFAPFVDTTAWPPYDFAKNTQETQNKNYALGFIVATNATTCEASWGTYYKLDSNELNMLEKVQTIQANGGRALLSFGGAASTPLASACGSVSSLVAEYQRVVDTLHLKEIDFDIEGAYSRDEVSITRRSQALKILQENNPELKIWFTLATLPTGLTEAAGMTILRAAISNGVVISGVNIMAMDYGDNAAPNPSGKMGFYAIEAAKSLHTQLVSLYPGVDENKLWKMVGITPMIGMNDVTTEVFTQSDADEVLSFAQEKNIGLVSLWSANRDKECQGGVASYVSISCSSLKQDANAFTKIFTQYGK